jgi:hypothetical protein
MINVTFNLNNNEPNNLGKIFIVVPDYGVDSRYYFGVSGPSGVIKALPTQPDLSGTSTGLTVSFSVNIPKDQNGNYIQGIYTISVKVEEIDGESVDVIVDAAETYSFCDYRQDVQVEIIDDCYSKTLVVKDNTPYHQDHTIVRTITVQSPMIAGEDDVQTITSSETPLLVSLVRSSGKAYSNVTYGIQLEVDGSSDFILGTEMEFRVVYQYEYTAEKLVHCVTDPCQVIACADKRLKEWLAEACAVGGISKLSQTVKDKISLLTGYLSMYNYWLECENEAQAKYYYDKIKALTGDCDCHGVSGPVVIGESSIVYLRGFNNYELWIQDGNTGTLDEFFQTLYPVGEWTVIESSKYGNGSLPDPAQPLEYRILKTHLEFRGRVIKQSLIQPPMTTGFILLDNLTLPETGYGAVNIYNNQGECVGQLRRNTTTPTQWNVIFGTGYNHGSGNMFHGQVPLEAFASSTVITGGFYPSFSDWTAFTSGNMQNSYAPVGGDPLSWRTDGRFIYFKGKFGGGTWPTAGEIIIPASYWTAKGIALQPSSAVDTMETGVTGQGLRDGSLVVDNSGNIVIYGTGLSVGTEVIVTGVLVRNG